jgi:hypothetical protein
MCKYIGHDILLKPRLIGVLFCPQMSTFVCQQKMNTFVCKLAPKLYHNFPARVKHCYKLLQLGVVFLPLGTILAPRQMRIILICIRKCVYAYIIICLYNYMLI